MKKGISIEMNEGSKIDINFGDHVQKLLIGLKNPNMVFYKEDGSGYFLNYTNFGMDVMISEETQQVIKFILHTNYPIDTCFGTFERCMFNLPLESVTLEPNSKWSEVKGLVS